MDRWIDVRREGGMEGKKMKKRDTRGRKGGEGDGGRWGGECLLFLFTWSGLNFL